MIGIGLICAEYGGGDSYKKSTLNSIDYWSKKYPVTVLTNTPDFFISKDCETIDYDYPLFNFHDKMMFLGMLSKEYELAILIDTNKLPNKDITFNEDEFEPGLHSADIWAYSWEGLRKLAERNGIGYWDHWEKCLKISEIKNPPIALCEQKLAVKRHPNFEKYVNLVETKYKPVATENDRIMKEPLRVETSEGRAEGFSFALAAHEMGFPVFSPSFPLFRIKDDLKRQYL